MNTDQVLARAYANWLEDGFVELGLGLLLVIVGSLRAMLHFIGTGSLLYYWFAGGLFLLMFAYSIGVGYAINALKARISYPRTGYLKFKPRRRNFKRLTIILVLAGVFGALAGFAATAPELRLAAALVPIILSVIWSSGFTYAAWRIGLQRFYVLAVLAVSIGAALALGGVDAVLGVSFFYLGIGLAMLATGSFALALYLRRNEPLDLNEASL